MLVSISATAQTKKPAFEEQMGFFPMVRYSYQMPGGDLAERFGNNSAIGLELGFKNSKNWIYGFSYDWQFGSNVLERSMFDDLVGSEGQLIDKDGLFSEIRFNQRGHLIQGFGGKVLPLGAVNRNSGLVLQLGAGAMYHRIDIQASTAKVPQITGDYEKGYDKLNGGFLLSGFVGYQYLDPRKRVNFKAGVQLMNGFTHSLRSWDFDLRSYNDRKRRDMLTGLSIGIIVPVYTKDPNEEQFFID